MTEHTDHVLVALQDLRGKAAAERDRYGADVARFEYLIHVHLHGNNADPLAPLPPNVVDNRPRFCGECGDPVDNTSGHLLHTGTGQLHCGPADPDATGAHRAVPDGPGRAQTVPDREVPSV